MRSPPSHMNGGPTWMEGVCIYGTLKVHNNFPKKRRNMTIIWLKFRREGKTKPCLMPKPKPKVKSEKTPKIKGLFGLRGGGRGSEGE